MLQRGMAGSDYSGMPWCSHKKSSVKKFYPSRKLCYLPAQRWGGNTIAKISPSNSSLGKIFKIGECSCHHLSWLIIILVDLSFWFRERRFLFNSVVAMAACLWGRWAGVAQPNRMQRSPNLHELISRLLIIKVAQILFKGIRLWFINTSYSIIGH